MSKEAAAAAKARGNEAFTKGDYQTAIKEFTTAIENDPNDAIFYSNRSGAYASLKQYTEALSDAQRCVQLKPDFAKGYSRQGIALFNLNKLEEAKTAYETGLKLDPSNAQLKEGLDETTKKLSAASNPMASLFGPDMWVKLQANHVTRGYMSDPSFMNKMKMLQSNPNAFGQLAGDPQVSQALGVIFGLGTDAFKTAPGGKGKGAPFDMDMADAEEFTTKSTGSSSSSGSGGVHVEDDDDEAGMEDIDANTKAREVKREQPNKPQPKAPEPAKELTEEEKADLAAKAALRAKRDEADAYKAKGNDHYKKKEFEAAINEYKKAIEIEPTNIIYYNNLSAVYFEQKDYSTCISLAQQGIAASKEHMPSYKDVAKAYARMGSAYEKLDNLDLAIESLSKSLIEDYNDKAKSQMKALEALKKKREAEAYIDPVKSEEHKNKGNELYNSGKFAESIVEYTEAIKRDPKNFKVYSNRAASYIKLMDWARGMEDCEKCLSMDPTFVKAYLRKGKIQHFLKQYHKALSTYDEALKLEPTNEEVLEAKRATIVSIQSSDSDPERAKQAMADPEIQAILRDPTINKVLQDMQENPQAGSAAMRDPDIRKKIEKLIAAGVLQVK